MFAGRQIRGGPALNPGVWGNSLRVEVDYTTSDAASLFNLTILEVRIDGDRTTVLGTETFRNLTMQPGQTNNALDVVNQGSAQVQITRDTALIAQTAAPVPVIAALPAVPPFPRPVATGPWARPCPW